MMRVDRKRISTLLFSTIILGGFISYTESGNGPLKIAGYVLSLASLLGLTVMFGFVSRVRVSFVMFWSCFVGAITALSCLLSPQKGPIVDLFQNMSYPVINLLLLLIGFRIVFIDAQRLVSFVCALAVINSGAALAGSLGLIDYVPVFGEVATGRYIFGTRIPSSTGLNFNVNYYATSQACFFFLYGWLQQLRIGRLARTDILALMFLFATTLIGSSRGILAAMVGALATLGVIIAFTGPGVSKLRSGLVLFCLIGFTLFAVTNYYDVIFDVFRLERGLNYRDVIWRAGLLLWLERPILGWGSDIGSLLGQVSLDDLAGRSLHSGYFHTLVRGGSLLFIATYGLLAFTVIWGLGFRKQLWYRYRWPVAIVVFYLISSLFRTYSLGGVGLLPLLLGFAMSVCLYARREC